MFKVEYVYVPLTGRAYVAMDYCSALEVMPEDNSQMTLIFTHHAKNMEGERVSFKSNVIVPNQKISVSMLEN